ADGQDGRGVEAEGVVVAGQAHQVQVEVAVGAVGVDGAGGDPEGAGARGEPGAGVGGDGEDAGAGVDDLVLVVPVCVDALSGGEAPGSGGRLRRVADVRHN